MVITPNNVDAYLSARGIVPHMTDEAWCLAINLLSTLLGKQYRFQVKLLYQKEDKLRRYCRNLPDYVPRPYRFIDYISFWVGEIAEEMEIAAVLRQHNIPFYSERQQNGPEEEDFIFIIRVGPKNKPN